MTFNGRDLLFLSLERDLRERSRDRDRRDRSRDFRVRSRDRDLRDLSRDLERLDLCREGDLGFESLFFGSVLTFTRVSPGGEISPTSLLELLLLLLLLLLFSLLPLPSLLFLLFSPFMSEVGGSSSSVPGGAGSSSLRRPVWSLENLLFLVARE